MVELATSADVARRSAPDAPFARGGITASRSDALPALASVAIDRWQALAAEACEPNGFYLPDWALAIYAFARGRTGLSALTVWSDASGPARLIGIALLMLLVTLFTRRGLVGIPDQFNEWLAERRARRGREIAPNAT